MAKRATAKADDRRGVPLSVDVQLTATEAGKVIIDVGPFPPGVRQIEMSPASAWKLARDVATCAQLAARNARVANAVNN